MNDSIFMKKGETLKGLFHVDLDQRLWEPPELSQDLRKRSTIDIFQDETDLITRSGSIQHSHLV